MCTCMKLTNDLRCKATLRDRRTVYNYIFYTCVIYICIYIYIYIQICMYTVYLYVYIYVCASTDGENIYV